MNYERQFIHMHRRTIGRKQCFTCLVALIERIRGEKNISRYKRERMRWGKNVRHARPHFKSSQETPRKSPRRSRSIIEYADTYRGLIYWNIAVRKQHCTNIEHSVVVFLKKQFSNNGPSAHVKTKRRRSNEVERRQYCFWMLYVNVRRESFVHFFTSVAHTFQLEIWYS